MEAIIERMQEDATGVSVKNVKTFMNKIPSVFTGTKNKFDFNFDFEFDPIDSLPFDQVPI